MRNSKPFSPPDSSFSLNESIAFTSYPSQKSTLGTQNFPISETLKLEAKSSKNLSNFDGKTTKNFTSFDPTANNFPNYDNTNYDNSNNFPNSRFRFEKKNLNDFEKSLNFEKISNLEKKSSYFEKNPNFEVSEKTGYNYISILKEFTDQAHFLLGFDYEPQINSFLCVCTMNKLKKGQGTGSNKQEAKKQASKQTILLLLKESSTNYCYFSRFLNIEKGLFEEENESFLQEKDPENESIVYLNQYCQQRFGQNPTFEYEISEKGFVVTIKGGNLVEIAEGPSKKLVYFSSVFSYFSIFFHIFDFLISIFRFF